jgi:hypothetical protein
MLGKPATLNNRLRVFAAPAGIFLSAMALYLLTFARTIQWGDLGGFVLKAYNHSYSAQFVDHPLWMLITSAFLYLPAGTLPERFGFALVLYAAIALTLFFVLAKQVSGSAPAAAIATGVLALSHLFWSSATVPKAFTFNSMILAAELLLVMQWRRTGNRLIVPVAAFIGGLSMLVHLALITTWPGLAWLILSRPGTPRIRTLVQIAAAFAAGLIPLLVWTSLNGELGIYLGTAGFAADSVESYAGQPVDLVRNVVYTVANFGYQFFFALPIAAYGLFRLFKGDRSVAIGTGLIVLGNVAFVWLDRPAGGRSNVEFWAYYHISYLIVALWVAVGIAALAGRLANHRALAAAAVVVLLATPVASYFAVPRVFRPVIEGIAGIRDIPGRDPVLYFAQPWKQDDMGAENFARESLLSLPPSAVLIADWTPYTPLVYVQSVEGVRPDVTIVLLSDSATFREMCLESSPQHPVYLADAMAYYPIDALQGAASVQREGLIYRVVLQS